MGQTGVLFWHAMIDQAQADVAFMQAALEEAQLAAQRGEVPVGAVLAIGDQIVARAGNRTIGDCDPTAHAEVIVLREAARAIGNYRFLQDHPARRSPRTLLLHDLPQGSCECFTQSHIILHMAALGDNLIKAFHGRAC